MIDNFAPQPYPLECSTDGGVWSLVIGWKMDPSGNIVPLVALETGLTSAIDTLDKPLRYRPAGARNTVAPRVAAPVAAPRRDRGA